MNSDRGFILLLAFGFMVFLTLAIAGLTFLVTHETRDIGAQVEDAQLLYLAEAGVERAMHEIRNDYTTSTQTGTADLRGSATTGSSSVGNVARIRYHSESSGNATINNNADIAQIRTFDVNYTNTRIISVFLGIRASRASSGTGATIQVTYTTNGVFPQAGNTALTQALTTTSTDYAINITADRTWTWSTIMTSNFILRAVRTAGSSNINLDCLYLRVTYEIDTGTEAWSTGTYQSYPITLGAGTVQSVSLTAEQGKVHLNTATQALLRYLMVEYGILDATANTVATNIVSYRASNNLDSVEELQQVTGMTTAIYDAIKDNVTVYSFINTNAQRPSGSRAPININTAAQPVLEAVFDALSLGTTDAASLAADIVATRATTPFTCFFSANAAVTTDFYGFVFARGYLSASGNPDERDRVLDNADASSLVPVSGSNAYNGLTTEFSYDTNAFKVDSLAQIDNRGFRIKTILSDQGTRTFTNFAGDTTSTGYRQEIFE